MRTRALWLFPAVGVLFAASSLEAVPVHHWSHRFGDGDVYDQIGNSVAMDASFNVVVTGSFGGTVDFGGGLLTSTGSADIFVAKFDADGNHLWSQRFGEGDVDDQIGNSVAADASGNVVVTGRFSGSADFGGGTLTSTGSADIFVAKFDADGNHLWSQRFGEGDVDDQIGNSVAADASGNAVVTGWFSGSVDFGGDLLSSTGSADIFVVKFDADGNHFWSQRFGDFDSQSSRSVAADGSGNVVIAGSFGGTVDFGGGPLASTGSADIFVARFAADGNHLWSRRFGEGDVDDQIGNSVAADVAGNVVVTGWFSGSADFGGGPLTAAGADDIFVARFREQPLPVLITRFEAKTRQGTVEITWEVWSDEALESFALYRRGDARPQAIVIAEGSFNHATRSYIDASVEPGTTYYYELLIHTQNGDNIRSPVATVTVPRFEATLGQNFPNPFKPATVIEYTLGEQSSAVVGIYDAGGRLVVRLDQGVRDAGTYQVEWDGLNAGGRSVGSGVYFYRLEGAPRVAPKKMVLLK